MCFSGEKSKKKNVKIKTNNEKIVETGMSIWYNTYKKNSYQSQEETLQCQLQE